MPPCFRSTRRPRFRRWIAWTRSCRCRRAAPNAMALSTYRHGTLSLYAALNTRTGEIVGQTAPRHTSQAFVEFLTDVVAPNRVGSEIHVIVDNLSAHKTKTVDGVSGGPSAGASALHADLLVVAESSRTLVQQDRARPARARASSRRSRLWRGRSAATSRDTTNIRNPSDGPTTTRRIGSLSFSCYGPLVWAVTGGRVRERALRQANTLLMFPIVPIARRSR